MQTVKPLGAVWGILIVLGMIVADALDRGLFNGAITELVGNPAVAGGIVMILSAFLRTVVQAGKVTTQGPEVMGARSVNWTSLPLWRRVL